MNDLTPKIVRIFDNAEFSIGGAVRETTVVQFTLGTHGPFTHTFDRGPQRHEIDRVMQDRRTSLEGLL